jgi:hypothetical protein
MKYFTKILCVLLLAAASSTFAQPQITGDIHFLGAFYSKKSSSPLADNYSSAIINAGSNVRLTWAIENSNGDSITLTAGAGIQPILLFANILFSIIEDETYNPLFLEHGFEYSKQLRKSKLLIGYNGLLMNVEAIELKRSYIPGLNVGGAFTILKDINFRLYLNAYYNELVPYKAVNRSNRVLLLGPQFSLTHHFRKGK